MKFGKYLAVIVMGLMLLSDEAFAQKTLRMKFVKGSSSVITLLNTTTIETNYAGNKSKTDLTMEMDLSQTVTDTMPNGSAIVRQKLSRIKMSTAGGGLGATLSYDSSTPEDSAQPSPLSLGLKPLVGAEFEIAFNNRGEVLDVTPPEDLLKKLSENQATAGFAQLFNGEAFKSMLSQSSVVLPAQAISQGDKWETKIASNAQLGGAAVTISYVYGGTVEIGGKDIWEMTARDTAKKVAVVLQEHPTNFGLTVREIVALGRTPHHIGFGGGNGGRDEQVVEAALQRMEVRTFSNRSLGTLSGGERQRVMVARALAQEPSILVLDEPTNHLDIRHQLEILELIKDLPLTIISSLHDLNMAADTCDEVAILKDGRLLGVGTPKTVFSADAISRTFEVTASYERLAPSDKNLLTFNLKN